MTEELENAMKEVLKHIEQQYDQWVKNGFKDPPQSSEISTLQSKESTKGECE